MSESDLLGVILAQVIAAALFVRQETEGDGTQSFMRPVAAEFRATFTKGLSSTLNPGVASRD